LATSTRCDEGERAASARHTPRTSSAELPWSGNVAMLAASFDDVPAGVEQVKLSYRGLTRVGRFDRMLRSLHKRLDDATYDVVHAMLPVDRCHVYHPHAGLARAMAASQPRSRFRARQAEVEGELLESPAPPLVLCLSQYVRRSVREWYDLDDAHLPILFNAVDTEKYDPARRPEVREQLRASWGVAPAHCVALFVGQDLERKGLRETILAMEQFRDSPRMRLVVVGRPSASDYLSLAERLGVRDRIIKLDHTDDPYGVYRAADFLVLPTKHDPCSLVVLEALAMGIPVISTRFNGACEIMRGGVHGTVLEEPTDVDALATAMRHMLDDEVRLLMSKAALLLRPVLAYEQHLTTLLEIYGRVARRY